MKPASTRWKFNEQLFSKKAIYVLSYNQLGKYVSISFYEKSIQEKYTMLKKAVGLQRIANKQSNRKSLVIVYRKSRLLGRTPIQLVWWTQVKTIKNEQILIKYDLRRVIGLGVQKKKNLLAIKKTLLARVLKQKHSG